jgi:HECT-domain (ubiquitin-transferase)
MLLSYAVRVYCSLSVTNENLPQYLEAQLKYRLMTRIHMQLTEFLRGFYDVVPEVTVAQCLRTLDHPLVTSMISLFYGYRLHIHFSLRV